MFDFLSLWDRPLESFEKDIESSLRGEVRSWITHAQIFCERVFKLYNKRERYFSLNSSKLTLGSFLNDQGFRADFSKKTGFRNFNDLKDINEASNEIKHMGVPFNLTESQTQKILQSIHDLSLKSYNYLENGGVTEKYDSQYFKTLMDQKDHDTDLTIQYADEIIQKKNELIRELMDDLDVMNEFSSEDIEELNRLKPRVERCEKSVMVLDKVVDILFQGSVHCLNRILDLKDSNDFDFDEFNQFITDMYDKPSEKAWHEFICRENITDESSDGGHSSATLRRRDYEYSDDFNIDDVDGDYYLS